MPGGENPDRPRSERGHRRRHSIIEAASAVLMEDGFAGVSHRSVARRAGLPVSATTYYFASLDALVEATVRHLAERWMGAARAAVDALPSRIDSIDELTDTVVHVAALSPSGVEPLASSTAVSLYERYVEAARHPSLRAVVAQYDAEIEALVAELLRRGGVSGADVYAGIVLAVVDGALLRCHAEGLPSTAATSSLRTLLQLLGPATPRDPG